MGKEQKKNRKIDKKKWITNILLVIIILLILIPIINLVIWSVTGRWPWPSMMPEVYTMRGMKEIFRRKSDMVHLFATSIGMSVVVALLSVLIGLMTARAIVFYEFRGKKIIYFLSILPFLVPATVFGMGINVSFIRWGLSGNVIGVTLVHLICSLPYAVRLMIDGCEASGNKLEEQARVLGAGGLQIFWKITLPVLAPVILSALSMSYIVSFSQYFLTLLIGGGRVKTFSIVMVPYLQNGDRTIASSYSLIFLAITLIVFGIFEFLIRRLNKESETVFYS